MILCEGNTEVYRVFKSLGFETDPLSVAAFVDIGLSARTFHSTSHFIFIKGQPSKGGNLTNLPKNAPTHLDPVHQVAAPPAEFVSDSYISATEDDAASSGVRVPMGTGLPSSVEDQGIRLWYLGSVHRNNVKANLNRMHCLG